MSRPLQVDYDKKYNRFLVSCPMWANDMVRQFPAKRWNKTTRSWAVAPVKQNIDVLAKDLSAYCDLTPAAEAEVTRLTEQATSMVKKTEFPVWYKFKTTPDPHQVDAFNHLYGLRAMALHMDRGTGKSKTSIDITCALRMEGKVEVVLILCKLTLRENWIKEWDAHSPLPFKIFLPSTDKPAATNAFISMKHDLKIMVCGFESLSAGGMVKVAERFLLSNPKAMIIADETHLICNHSSIRSQRTVSLGRKAEYRQGLTGTPIAKNPMDLFMQYEFLDPEVIGIGDYYAFRNRYAIMGGYTDDRGRPLEIVGYQNLEELTRLVAPYTYQCDKSVLKLPPKSFETRVIKMTEAQAALYKQIRKDKKYTLGGRERVFKNTLELALRLHQVAQGHLTKYTAQHKIDVQSGEMLIKEHGEFELIMPWDKNPKILEVADILEEGQFAPTIIWCNYKADVMNLTNMMDRRFPKIKYRRIIGGQQAENHGYITDFQKGKIDLLINMTSVGGTGHDMFRGELNIYLNNNEKLIDRLQSEDRTHRRGLTHPVHYIDLIMDKTVDRTIVASIADKKNLSDYIRERIGEEIDGLTD